MCAGRPPQPRARTKTPYVNLHHAVTANGREYVVSEHTFAGYSSLVIGYDCWEKTQEVLKADGTLRYFHAHSTVTTFGKGQWYGTVDSRQLPDELDALPQGWDRVGRVADWLKVQHAEALAVIRLVNPLVDDGILGAQIGEPFSLARVAELRKLGPLSD